MYTEKVIEHFKNPRNVGEIKDADTKSTEGSLACGDMVTMYLKVDPKTLKIKDIKFKSYGCASNIATCSVLTELAKGKTLKEAKGIKFQEIAEALGGLPTIKMHCAVLATVVLHSAIKNYEEKHGLIDVKEEANEENVKDRLRHVMDPDRGRDIVSLNMVKDVLIKGDTIEVLVELPPNYHYAENIFDEIKEKLISIPKIKKIEVQLAKTGMIK
ncbi:MAG: iron-sulfur cluster assembly scaffold protein [Candidatus Altiarchaeota archaeon]|nr:iron-sulfur cluster assembly scaffold protein [Candidatus Altiarchaeota archaeon]